MQGTAAMIMPAHSRKGIRRNQKQGGAEERIEPFQKASKLNMVFRGMENATDAQKKRRSNQPEMRFTYFVCVPCVPEV
jgi:hypothetical protein